MQEKKYNDSKKEIRSVLLTYPKGVSLEVFIRDYKSLLGERLPSRALGFSSDTEFLRSMPDVVNVHTSEYGKVQLTGIPDEKSMHIQKLVSKQRITKPNNNKRQPIQRRNINTVFKVRELEPFLPGPLKAEILELMHEFPYGVSFSAFSLAYHRRFKKYLPLSKGFDTLEGMVKLIPQLEVVLENNEKIICPKGAQRDGHQGAHGNVRNSPASNMEDKSPLQIKNSYSMHKSGISDDILESFQQLLKKCPDGILDLHFPPLYESVIGKSFDLHGMGYNSILNLVDAVPHIFKRVLNPEDNRSWIILPANASVSQSLKVDNHSPATNSRKQSPLKPANIPADASSPVLQYIQPAIPENVDLDKYVPIFVSAIINPSLFWFQLQTDEASKHFEMFERDMGTFYELYSYKYKMNDSDIAIGSTCVILCPEDKEWYRAVIKSIPGRDLVNVSYIDYGSRENIPRDNLFYVRSKYHDYPACAFQAKLAGVKPPQNASLWSVQAQQRFIELCSRGILMADLKSLNKDTYLVYLCDTSGETDIYLNDILINEKLAVFCYENMLDVNIKDCGNNTEEFNIRNGKSPCKSDSGGEFSSRSDQDILQSDTASESENLAVKRKLCFSPQEVQYSDKKLNTSPSGKRSSSKRYVKLMELCAENTKMHFINLESKLYMSCADISKLIWSDKDSKFLIERLKYKDVDVPFLELSKENHAELFAQCIWYKIPEYQRLEAQNSSLIVCPLEWAFKILNIFGHPSVSVRLIIQDEIRRFDPFDPVWKEFCYEEPDAIEKEIEEKLRNLCLYDLRAKNEAFKIKRQLLRVENNSADDEIKMIEVHQKVIARRMKEIEALCSQYPSPA